MRYRNPFSQSALLNSSSGFVFFALICAMFWERVSAISLLNTTDKAIQLQAAGETSPMEFQLLVINLGASRKTAYPLSKVVIGSTIVANQDLLKSQRL